MLRVVFRMLKALAISFTVTVSAIAGESGVAEQHLAEAREVVAQFAGRLKPMLQSEIQAAGPVNAIHVCAEKAPELAQTMQEESGWHIRRVSLQPRNPNAQPDDWEAEQLRQFEAGRKAGASPKALNAHMLGTDSFRYMQAQITDGLCLLCHGEALDPAIEQALLARYPQDKATGYTLGEVRGAISLSKPVVTGGNSSGEAPDQASEASDAKS